MAKISIQDLDNTLEETRARLLAAGDKDGMVSREDLRRMLEEESSHKQRVFLQFFYNFLRKLEDRPRMRVTRDVIDRGIRFIQEQIVPSFEIADSFSNITNQKIVNIHPSAYPMAMQLIRITKENAQLSTLEVAEHIAQFTDDLFFDDFGSEGSEPIESFYLEADLQELTPATFTAAMNLDLNDPKDAITEFSVADEALLNFIEMHFRFGLAEKAKAIVDLMKSHLSHLSVIILGEDYNSEVPPNHPVFVVGIGHDGDLGGFRSEVIWT